MDQIKNYKMKCFNIYFEKEQQRQLKEQQEKQIKRDLFIVDLINFVGYIFLLPALILTIYYNYLCYDLYKYRKNKFDPKKAKKVLEDLRSKLIL